MFLAYFVTQSSLDGAPAVASAVVRQGQEELMAGEEPDNQSEAAAAPVVVLYDNATSWMVSSLTGDIAPMRVVVDGDGRLLEVVQKAFPDAEVRRQERPSDRDWAELVVVRGGKNRRGVASMWPA
jgi:hypothetical protein